MKLIKEDIKKILCIKPRGIGDIILSTIILENLHSYFPEAKIDYLTEIFAKDAVINSPLVNKVLTMKQTEFPLKAALKIRKEKYDLILDLWSNPRSAQITFLSGVKYRVGYAYRGRKYAYNILASSDRGAHHSAEHNLELLKVLGIPVISKKTQYFVTEDDNITGINFIKNNFPPDVNLCGIIPSGGWASKRCDASKWVDICSALHDKYKMMFLILWGPGDEKDANYIIKRLPEITVLAPHTSVSQLAGLINNCNLIIANDSGPMHIAAALGIPTLGLFGPTDPKSHGPYSENSGYIIKEDLFCIICNKMECPYKHECFINMSVESIVTKAGNLMENNKQFNTSI
jgi:lipopolysaccharide heptosyltransferase II